MRVSLGPGSAVMGRKSRAIFPSPVSRLPICLRSFSPLRNMVPGYWYVFPNSKLYLLCSHIELHGVYFHDVLATVSCLSNRLSHTGSKQYSTSPQNDHAISPNRPIKSSVPLQSSNSTHHFRYFPVYSCLRYGNICHIAWSGSIFTMLLVRSVWAGWDGSG